MELRGLDSKNVWDYENAFYWFSPAFRMNKLLAHYELYRSIVDLPGSVMELGVYKGASLVRLATFRGVLENEYSRKIIGFDAFGQFPTDNLESDDDLSFIDGFEAAGGAGLERSEMQGVLDLKKFGNVELVKGNVFDTLPAYLESHPETRISFLHLDMDVKEPTAFAIELLYDRIVPGGLVVIDDYNAVAGATDAIDSFAAEEGQIIEKLPYYSVPAFIRKPV